MKLNDTVYKKTLCQVRIHLVFDKSFAKRLCIDDSKQVTEGFYLQCLGTTSSGNNRYREKHSIEPIALETR
jgi:hypothetical protein